MVSTFLYALSLIPTQGSNRKMKITRMVMLGVLGIIAFTLLHFFWTW
jgi:hypothetical protein